ncbi:putative esterase [Talaromyces proteolyticus]|uniref:Esterase n=1 Tax=Talaromyces proteolyticus TaxID=1131652 RepID=A0AAD4PTH0_9EURO|nr:putative esterase [Talaromyces proteolyticus]KAH8688743.1 putative esterase [Talaromyces proteolyticus]
MLFGEEQKIVGTGDRSLHNSIPPELLERFDPVFVDYYNKYNVGRVYRNEVPIEEFRKNPAKYSPVYGRAAGPDIYRITEEKCPVKGREIGVRIFEPAPIIVDGCAKKRGAYINLHRGRWVVGSLLTDHGYCKQRVHGVQGDLEAFNWIRQEKANEFNLDPDRFAIGGPSAGGHLAAVIAHLCRDNKIPLRLQVLCVPMVDIQSAITPEGKFDWENCPYYSYREMELSAGMTTARVQYFINNSWGLPPALVFTAEMDPLRDEGEAYAEKLRQAGCEVYFTRVKAAPHSFVVLDGVLESGKRFNARVIEALKMYLA